MNNIQEILTNITQLWLLDYIISWIVILLIFIWAWSILWVTKDISARTDNIWYQMLSIMLIIFFTPIFWLPLYILIRPIYYKYEKNWRKEALALNVIYCKNCDSINLRDYKFCISCWTNLRIQCKECKNFYPWNQEYCENCWAPNIEI